MGENRYFKELGTLLVWVTLFCTLKIINNGFEARLGLMLCLCSKVACFLRTFKDFSGREGVISVFI